ncbi:MAG TPA: hypothetical protein VFO16_24905 [Pseudonocardiaceae bacterium]|nr:hypothetical protein [Pseudonocardiaceae bacterium]
MTAVIATRLSISRLSRRARTALLTAHVALSVGWFGLDGALVALEVTGLGADPGERAGIAAAMSAIAVWVLIPVVFTALVSGLVLSLSTPWGLVRHWWVLIKCGIAAALTAAGLSLMIPRLHQIIAGEAEPVEMTMLIGRSIALALLLAATALSVIKPWGKTPRGRSVGATRQAVRKVVSRSSGTAVRPPSVSPHREPSHR